MDVLLNATTRRDVAGNVVGVIGVGQDITERKQVEVEKTRVAQELQTFIDTANAPIFGIDAQGLVNEWNNKAAAITGFSRLEVLGKNLVQVTSTFAREISTSSAIPLRISTLHLRCMPKCEEKSCSTHHSVYFRLNRLRQDFITQEYQVSVKEVLDNALKGRETANFEFPLYTKDRQRVEVLLNATTRRDVSGAVVGMIGVGQDITERKQVEVEKAQVAQELQTFIDTANAPIFGIDACGLVNEWNNKAAAITGFSREEVLGKNLVQVCVTQPPFQSQANALDGCIFRTSSRKSTKSASRRSWTMRSKVVRPPTLSFRCTQRTDSAWRCCSTPPPGVMSAEWLWA